MLYKNVGVLVMNYLSVWRAERCFVQHVSQKINQDLTKVVSAKHVDLFFSHKHRRDYLLREWITRGFFFFSSLASQSVFCIKRCLLLANGPQLSLSFVSPRGTVCPVCSPLVWSVSRAGSRGGNPGKWGHAEGIKGHLLSFYNTGVHNEINVNEMSRALRQLHTWMSVY